MSTFHRFPCPLYGPTTNGIFCERLYLLSSFSGTRRMDGSVFAVRDLVRDRGCEGFSG